MISKARKCNDVPRHLSMVSRDIAHSRADSVLVEDIGDRCLTT
jgi:hypothetical protein